MYIIANYRCVYVCVGVLCWNISSWTVCAGESQVCSDLHEAPWVFIWWIDDLVIVTMEIVTMRLLWSVAETQRAGKACFGEIWRAVKCWRFDVKTHIIYMFSVDCGFLFLPRLHTGNRWFLWNDKISEFDDNIGWQNEAGMHVYL